VTPIQTVLGGPLAHTATASRASHDRRPTNVSSVRQRSPLRYPGGKTWLVPQISEWLASLPERPILIEPFAGGAIASLAAVMEGLVLRAVMVERDESIACLWKTILREPEALASRILEFEMTRDNVLRLLEEQECKSELDSAFRIFVKNRTHRGGILAQGASLMKNGENGKGVASRWYPNTLAARILKIGEYADRLEFIEGDGFAEIERWMATSNTAFFVDPPYTASNGKRAGRRLYRYNDVNHGLLFDLMAKVRGSFMMSYDENTEVLGLAQEKDFRVEKIPMKNTHHAVMNEILIYPQ